jgi:preprotein translocase subunit SecA
MDVVVIPTNKPMIRMDHPDAVYKTEKAKFEAVVREIEERHKTGQPMLVGTISIEKSEKLSHMLKVRGIPHEVLNAKNHAKEAEIIAQAGQRGAVTIATNMAGRGTDIVLGEGVKELGGLHVIGTERHEARRIDNQLRGRSGRQGDPGSSRFYVSLEDDLMRLFGSERIMGLMERLGWEDDQAIDHPQISKAIENAQKKVETRHFEIRRQVLDYDDVLNKQREVIYAQRRAVLLNQDIGTHIADIFGTVFSRLVSQYADDKVIPEEWDLDSLLKGYAEIVGRPPQVTKAELEDMKPAEMAAVLQKEALQAYSLREAEYGSEIMRRIEKMVLLQVTDSRWMEHLRAIDDLREGIGLRAYGQKDPLMEYQFEAFNMFQQLVAGIQEDCLKLLFRVRLVDPSQAQPKDRLQGAQTNQGGEVERAPRKVEDKVGRNDPCPCGSGKKYKKCCGR